MQSPLSQGNWALPVTESAPYISDFEFPSIRSRTDQNGTRHTVLHHNNVDEEDALS